MISKKTIETNVNGLNGSDLSYFLSMLKKANMQQLSKMWQEVGKEIDKRDADTPKPCRDCNKEIKSYAPICEECALKRIKEMENRPDSEVTSLSRLNKDVAVLRGCFYEERGICLFPSNRGKKCQIDGCNLPDW